MEKLQKTSIAYLDGVSRGDLLSRMTNDIDSITEGITQGMTQLVSCVVTVIVTMGFMVTLNPIVAASIITLTPLSIITTARIAKKCQGVFKKQQRDLGLVSGLSEEMISAQKLVIAYNYTDKSVSQFSELNESFRKSSMSAGFYSSLSNPITRFINNIAYLVAGVLGVVLRLSVGTIGGFLVYASRFARPFNDVGNILPQLQSSAASVSRILDILAAPEEQDPSKATIDPTAISPQIVFDDASFSYNKNKPFISGLNLTLKPGQKAAVVGRTGSGKTTLVNLLLRFYDIDSGNITIGEYNIFDISADSLRHCFGMVLQDTWIMNETVAYNIAYARPDATQEEIVAAAKAARCHEFIIQTEKGYDTILGGSNDELSEGQRQLICIARVMLENAPMLILDEATSSIDTRTERMIGEAFDEITKNKTSIIIAHRLSTIRNADVIIVLDNGKIVEYGSHHELLRINGLYHTLYNAQFAHQSQLK
jgi:ABC-type multidrug transport system fused ATPase/permease subunit